MRKFVGKGRSPWQKVIGVSGGNGVGFGAQQYNSLPVRRTKDLRYTQDISIPRLENLRSTGYEDRKTGTTAIGP